VNEEDQARFEALKREIALGIADLENGRSAFICTKADSKRLVEEISRRGRAALRRPYRLKASKD
jgi:hypothetical protein